MTTALMNNYKRQAVNFIRGEGVYLYDDNGKRYLDGLAGIAVCGLGHAHPELGTIWQIKINDKIDIINVYATSGNICSYQYINNTFF